MALNDVALASRALIRIGAAPITSFDDGTAESEIAGALYAPVRDGLLSAYPWTFATGQVALTQLSTAPIADYSFAFGLPNDYLRAISAGTGTKGRGLNYRIANGALHTNASAVVLTYVFLPDESEFPPFFDQALIARLSAEFTIPVTESTSRAEAHFRIADQEFQRARQIDAQQDTPNKIESFTLVDVRN
ncbi:MAG TPA: hypothetical protein PK513_01075 [Alphaproteobacteria bacterium]|nr:hypothetical protein [Alphaproteobacteria bacterium]USO04768.1 MAG: hypothetical protein H6859_06260 [Rhodospirillales bacterium]HOO81079.1 hypothetical protein [Alphaproteobacteria bacterium]